MWQAGDGEVVANVQYCCVHLGSFGRIICLSVFTLLIFIKTAKVIRGRNSTPGGVLVVSVRNHFSYSMILIRLVGDNKVSK